MATPTLTLINNTTLNNAESTTGWTKFDLLDTDIKKEGNTGITGTFRTDGSVGYYDAGTAPATAANRHVRMWINTTSLPYLQPESLGGVEALFFDGTTTEYIVVFGSDTYDGGWKNIVIDMNLLTTLTLANVQRWGVRTNYHSSAKNVDNTWADAFKYLDGYYFTGGTSGDELLLSDIALADKGTTVLYGYGILTNVDGVMFAYGEIQVGNGATTTYLKMDGEVLVFTENAVAAGLYQFTGVGSGCNIDITNSVIKSGGANDNTRFILDYSDTNITLSFVANVIQRASTILFTSGQDVASNTFNDCGQITHGGADMRFSSVAGYEGTADTAALIYNVNVDPDGEMDGMSFTKGTAATHAIQFGATAPQTMTIRDIDFSGYNANDAQTDSTLLFADTGADVTWTVNLIGCSGNISFKKTRAGDTVTLVIDPVTFSVTVKDATTGLAVTGARVLVWVANGANYPYFDTISISGSGSTATVTHTAHGLGTNDYIIITGANEDEYNGTYQITVTGVNTYTYNTGETVTTGSPTGTIQSTFAVISGLTSGTGILSDSRTYSSNQDIQGWVRKGTTSPLYQQSSIADTINSVSGKSINVLLISDE